MSPEQIFCADDDDATVTPGWYCVFVVFLYSSRRMDSDRDCDGRRQQDVPDGDDGGRVLYDEGSEMCASSRVLLVLKKKRSA